AGFRRTIGQRVVSLARIHGQQLPEITDRRLRHGNRRNQIGAAGGKTRRLRREALCFGGKRDGQQHAKQELAFPAHCIKASNSPSAWPGCPMRWMASRSLRASTLGNGWAAATVA